MTPKILIIDDVALNVELLQQVLGSEGFRTCSASSGLSGLDTCRSESPDLILLDVLMPDENGFEVCAKLKSDALTAHIPVIFLSALDDVKSKVRGFKVGGVDYVSKPVHGAEVLARVRVHLRIAETNRLVAREHHDRLEELRHAQQSILVRPENCPEASFAVFYEALEGAGGDFYDVVQVDPDVFGYFVADVSGHGVSAAFLTSAVKALLRQYTGPLFSPEDTMRGIDAVMRQMLGEGQYLTACYAHLNRRTQRLSVVSAGHPPSVVLSAAGVATVLSMDSDPIGIFSSLVLQHKDVKVSPGDRLFLYTDGLIESSPGGGRSEGIERLVAACLHHQSDPLSQAVASIAADIRSVVRRPDGDLLMLAVEVSA